MTDPGDNRSWRGSLTGTEPRRVPSREADLDEGPPGDRARRRLSRFGRFLAVGASNAVIDLGVFNALAILGPTRRPLQLGGYNTVAVILALLNSYWWNSRWTFRLPHHRVPRWSSASRRVLFAAQGGFNVLVNDLVVVAAAAALGASGLARVEVANASKVAGMLTASASSFLIMRFVIFREERPPS